MGEVGLRPVCVLGGGRSGTSLAARATILLGIDFGPDELMPPPNELNLRGFWELPDVSALNDDVRATWGPDRFRPPRLAPGWELAPELDPFRARIEAIVERYFGDGRRWGFKHSGSTLTAPLWASVVGELDYVVCVRNPLEVMASGRAGRHLLLPDPTDELPGWDLWTFTYCQALRNTAGARRLLVFYDDWLRDARAATDRLAAFVHGEAELVQPAVRERVAATVEEGLHRQRASELDLARADHVPVEVRALYFLLRQLSVAEDVGDTDRAAALQEVSTALDHRWPSSA